MNRFFLSVAIPFFFLSLFSLNAQMGHYERYTFPDGASLEEAKDLLETDLHSMRALRELIGFDMRFGIGDTDNEGKPLADMAPRNKRFTDGKIEKVLTAFFSKIEFMQEISYPQSHARPQIAMFSLAHTMGLDHNDLKGSPDFIFRKIYYKDGTSLDGHFEDMLVPGAKFVDSIFTDVSFSYPVNYTTVSVSATDTVYKLPDGSLLRFKDVIDNEISLYYEGNNSDKSLEYIVKILGRLEGDRYLKSNGSVIKSLPDEFMTDILLDVEQIYERMILKMDEGVFDNPALVEDSLWSAMQPLAAMVNETAANTQTVLTYQFGGDVKELLLFVADYETYTSEIMIRNWNLNQENESKLNVVKNLEIEKYGLVDMEGNWLNGSECEELREGASGYFDGQKHKDSETVSFYYDFEAKEMKALDYLILSRNTDSGILIVEDKNEKKGVVDSLRNEIIPNIFSEIEDHYYYDLLECITFSDDSLSFYRELYNYSGLRVLDGKYFHIDLGDDMLMTVEDRDSTFRIMSKNINTGQIVENRDVNKSEYQGDQHLRRDYNFGSDTYNYISPTEKIIIRGTEEYDFEDHHFIGQRAIVKKTDEDGNELFGFIDIKGNLVVPIVYTQVQPFSELCTYVEKGNTPLLIDQNNNIVKELPSRLDKVISFDVEDPLVGRIVQVTTFVLENGEKYDTRGELAY